MQTAFGFPLRTMRLLGKDGALFEAGGNGVGWTTVDGSPFGFNVDGPSVDEGADLPHTHWFASRSAGFGKVLYVEPREVYLFAVKTLVNKLTENKTRQIH